MSRCVRRLHCLQDERRDWVERSLRYHASLMAIDVLTYAVMNNHMHVVIRIRPDLVKEWSGREVVDKWLDLVPRRSCFGELMEADELTRQLFVADEAWVEERRARLCSMSWFMRLVKQKLAIRANKEDDVSGYFWDERFKSVALPDQRAILACMVYVDLNPFRAGEFDLPERGRFVGMQCRIESVRLAEKTQSSGAINPGGESLSKSWIVPLSSCGMYAYFDEVGWVYDYPCSLTEEGYLRLVGQTARMQRSGKHSLSGAPDGIIERLGGNDWLDLLEGEGFQSRNS